LPLAVPAPLAVGLLVVDSDPDFAVADEPLADADPDSEDVDEDDELLDALLSERLSVR
jgi:hypothetical protein